MDRASTRSYTFDYKWVVMFAACVTQLLSSGFVEGTMSFLPLYYEKHYNERTLSSNIGAIQLAVSFLGSVPVILLKEKIGERLTQLIGGTLTIAAMIGTAYSTLAYQGIFTNGVMFGLGNSFTIVAAYSMLAAYFPGEQLVQSALMMVCLNAGAMIFPKVIGGMMSSLGFKYTFLACASAMSLHIVVGVLFRPKKLATEDGVSEDQSFKSKLELKLRGRKSGIYHLPILDNKSILSVPSTYTQTTTQTTGQHNETTDSKDPEKTGAPDTDVKLSDIDQNMSSLRETELAAMPVVERNPRLAVRSTSRLSIILLQTLTSEKDNHDATLSKVRSIPGGDLIADLLGSRADRSTRSLLHILKNAHVLNFVVASFLLSAGNCSFNSNMADFSHVAYGYNPEELGLGFTIKGFIQLLSTVAFTVMAQYFTFSSTFLYVCAAAGNAAITASLIIGTPDIGSFYALLAVAGIFRGFNLAALFGSCLEITSPSQSVSAHMIQTSFDGVAALTFPYLASFLQVEVDIYAGLLLAGSLQAASALVLLPLSIKYLMVPKSYGEYGKTTDMVEQTGFFPLFG